MFKAGACPLTPKCVPNTGFLFLSKHGRPLVHAFGDRWRSSDVSDFVCRLGLIPRKICYVKCLVEGVQCSKLFQDFTRSICYIRPWMERRDVR